MKIYDESLYCGCGKEITIQESLFNNNSCDECSFSIDAKETEMEQVIEQGPYYRVVKRNGKYYPEFWSTIHNQWDPYLEEQEIEGYNVVCLSSLEEVKDFWQKKEF